MKALSFQIPKAEKESYQIQIDKVPFFHDLFHYHPESANHLNTQRICNLYDW